MTISDKEQWAKNDVFQLGRTKIAANKQRLESKWIGGYPTCRSCQFLFHGACDFSICRSIHVRSAARHLGRFFGKNISNAHRRIDYCWWFRNPVNSPVEVGSLSTIIYKVYISEVVQDFFHQQYVLSHTVEGQHVSVGTGLTGVFIRVRLTDTSWGAQKVVNQ